MWARQNRRRMAWHYSIIYLDRLPHGAIQQSCNSATLQLCNSAILSSVLTITFMIQPLHESEATMQNKQSTRVYAPDPAACMPALTPCTRFNLFPQSAPPMLARRQQYDYKESTNRQL